MPLPTGFWALIPSIFGFNLALWVTISASRFIVEHIIVPIASRFKSGQAATSTLDQPLQITPNDVAVIMAAHNEELALKDTLVALKKNIPAANIYVGSDASTDATVRIAQQHGVHVLDLQPNRGKAKVLTHLLEHFDILSNYKAVLIMDAELVVSDHYLDTILPYFNDPEVAAFVSHAISRWRHHWLPKWSMFFTAYRIRLWMLLYYGLRYGQTWKYTNVTPIIPGGSSVYRSSALSQIEIDTPGLVIEDFNMTFQVHHKRLGRIASHPSAYIIDQEPYSMRDYVRQVHRWFLGFWQTFFHHGFWPSFFWFATFAFILEMAFYSVIILTIPIIVFAILFTPLDSFSLINISFAPLGLDRTPVTPMGLFISVLVIDYIITVIAAWIEGKPALLFYGLGFFLLRYLDTFIFLYSLPQALLTKAIDSTWQSPTRRS